MSIDPLRYPWFNEPTVKRKEFQQIHRVCRRPNSASLANVSDFSQGNTKQYVPDKRWLRRRVCICSEECVTLDLRTTITSAPMEDIEGFVEDTLSASMCTMRKKGCGQTGSYLDQERNILVYFPNIDSWDNRGLNKLEFGTPTVGCCTITNSEDEIESQQITEECDCATEVSGWTAEWDSKKNCETPPADILDPVAADVQDYLLTSQVACACTIATWNEESQRWESEYRVDEYCGYITDGDLFKYGKCEDDPANPKISIIQFTPVYAEENDAWTDYEWPLLAITGDNQLAPEVWVDDEYNIVAINPEEEPEDATMDLRVRQKACFHCDVNAIYGGYSFEASPGSGLDEDGNAYVPERDPGFQERGEGVADFDPNHEDLLKGAPKGMPVRVRRMGGDCCCWTAEYDCKIIKGRMQEDSEPNATSYMEVENVIQDVDQVTMIKVKNTTGSALSRGDHVTVFLDTSCSCEWQTMTQDICSAIKGMEVRESATVGDYMIFQMAEAPYTCYKVATTSC